MITATSKAVRKERVEEEAANTAKADAAGMQSP